MSQKMKASTYKLAEYIKTLVSNPDDLISKPELHPGNPEHGKGEVTPQADPDYHTPVHT